jgi:hypothetical protein
MDGITQIFNSYVNLLISALPGSMDDEANLDGLGNKIVRMAETEEQQLALLANAALLAEELLPRAAMKLSSINQSNMDDLRKRGTDKQNRVPEQREWKRDSFCRQHALELIFTDEGDTHLSAEMYINMDNTVEEPEWVPSPIFQVVRKQKIITIYRHWLYQILVHELSGMSYLIYGTIQFLQACQFIVVLAIALSKQHLSLWHKNLKTTIILCNFLGQSFIQ